MNVLLKLERKEWQQMVAMRGLQKGPFTGPNPTDRGKRGIKRHILVDRRGAPVAFVIAPAELMILSYCFLI